MSSIKNSPGIIADKRGISAVVTTVLLILISVIAVILIAGFIIPMIKNSLSEGTSCFDLVGYIQVLDNQYSCYNSTTTNVMIERGMDNLTISGITLSIMSAGNSKRYDINSTNIPLPGNAKTYNLGLTYANGNVVKIASVTQSGKICDPEAFTLQPCE